MAAILVTPRRHRDTRGWFAETYNVDRYRALGIDAAFMQDNMSLSTRTGTLRGLHFQAPPYAQAKLVSCAAGRVRDVAVDLRRGSPTYGRWVAAELSADGGEQLYVPVGFAHGFVTLEPDSVFAYKVSAPYHQASEGGLRWDDPTIAVDWMAAGEMIVSDKDAELPGLAGFDTPFTYEEGVPLSLIRG